jgi:hypothetical protein
MKTSQAFITLIIASDPNISYIMVPMIR